MLITIDESAPEPIYRQIMQQIKEQIRDGRLKSGEPLPSVRDLADALAINLHTVRHAYDRLRDQGILRFRLGQRAKVAALRDRPASREEIESTLLPRLRELITDAFHLGLTAKQFQNLVEEALEQEE